MKILLALTVCAMFACDFASAQTCYTCTNCPTVTATGTGATTTAAQGAAGNCKTTMKFSTAANGATTVTVDRAVSAAACTDTFANALKTDGTAESFECCASTNAVDNCNNVAKQGTVIGCVVCANTDAVCAAGTGAAVFDANAFKGTSTIKQCQTTVVYDVNGAVTSVTRAAVATCTAAAAPALGTAGNQVACCNTNGCNKDVYAALTTAAPTVAQTTTKKTGDRIVMNSVLLLSAVIIAVL